MDLFICENVPMTDLQTAKHMQALGQQAKKASALMAKGVLAKDTHGSTIRLAPPIVVSKRDLDWGIDQLENVLRELSAK